MEMSFGSLLCAIFFITDRLIILSKRSQGNDPGDQAVLIRAQDATGKWQRNTAALNLMKLIFQRTTNTIAFEPMMSP